MKTYNLGSSTVKVWHTEGDAMVEQGWYYCYQDSDAAPSVVLDPRDVMGPYQSEDEAIKAAGLL